MMLLVEVKEKWMIGWVEISECESELRLKWMIQMGREFGH
jgi:hypothetical protein